MSDLNPMANLAQQSEVPEAPKTDEVHIPKVAFRQGIFDPQIANMAQGMYANKKQSGQAPAGQAGMSPPSTTPGTTPLGGKPGGTPK